MLSWSKSTAALGILALSLIGGIYGGVIYVNSLPKPKAQTPVVRLADATPTPSVEVVESPSPVIIVPTEVPTSAPVVAPPPAPTQTVRPKPSPPSASPPPPPCQTPSGTLLFSASSNTNWQHDVNAPNCDVVISGTYSCPPEHGVVFSVYPTNQTGQDYSKSANGEGSFSGNLKLDPRGIYQARVGTIDCQWSFGIRIA